MTDSIEEEATGGKGGGRVSGGGSGDWARVDAYWLATASGVAGRAVVAGRDGARSAGEEARWGNAGDIGISGSGRGQACPSDGGGFGMAGCERARAGPTGVLGFGEGGWGSDDGDASDGVEGWGARVTRSISSCTTQPWRSTTSCSLSANLWAKTVISPSALTFFIIQDSTKMWAWSILSSVMPSW